MAKLELPKLEKFANKWRNWFQSSLTGSVLRMVMHRPNLYLCNGFLTSTHTGNAASRPS